MFNDWPMVDLSEITILGSGLAHLLLHLLLIPASRPHLLLVPGERTCSVPESNW